MSYYHWEVEWLFVDYLRWIGDRRGGKLAANRGGCRKEEAAGLFKQKLWPSPCSLKIIKLSAYSFDSFSPHGTFFLNPHITYLEEN
jgi:hypothetical protein